MAIKTGGEEVNADRTSNGMFFQRGENELVFRGLPASLDPATVSLAPLGAGADLRLLDARFEHDGAAVERLFARYVGRSITVQDGGVAREGALLSAPARGAADVRIGILVKQAAEPDPRLPPLLLVHGATFGASRG